MPNSLLSLSTAAESTVTWDVVSVPPRFDGWIGVVVTTTNADGSPRTDLSKADFSVTLLDPDAQVVPSTLSVANPWPLGSPLPGVYYLGIVTSAPQTDPSAWVNGVYHIVVSVTKLVSRAWIFLNYAIGLTVASVQVSFQQP